MKKCFQQQIALTPTFSHRMGEGELPSVSLAVVSAGFTGRVASRLRRTGVAPVSDFQSPALAESSLACAHGVQPCLNFLEMETGATPVLRRGGRL